jgi:hypothetical protein
MHPRTLTYSVDHTVLETRVKVQRSFPVRGLRKTNFISYKNKGGNPEYLSH